MLCYLSVTIMYGYVYYNVYIFVNIYNLVIPT